MQADSLDQTPCVVSKNRHACNLLPLEAALPFEADAAT